jgi:hypothetical protein
MPELNLSGVVSLFLAACVLGSSSARSIVADDLDNIIFEGTIRDAAGAVIGGARVTARQTSTGRGRSTISTEEGRYRIVVGDPGPYLVSAEAPGFSREQRQVAEAVTGRTFNIDLTLSPAGVNEQVTVVGSQVPLVDTARTVVGETLTSHDLESLPIPNRDPLRLVLLLGGVAEAPLLTSDLAEEGSGSFLRSSPEEAGVFSLTGAPATSNNLTIDGLDNNDDRAARERVTLNPEAIAEVQVVTNQYAAEYGRASGGRINIRTRGGERQYKGAAYVFAGDESLNANTFFRNARGLGRIPQRKLREGLVLSGPLPVAGAFSLISYERLDVTDSVEISALVPVETNPLFPLPKPNNPIQPGNSVGLLSRELSTPETKNTFSLRLDFNLNESHNLTARADLSLGGNKRGFPGGARLAETILIEGRDSHSVSVSDNLVLSSRVVNQARFQLSRLMPRNKGRTASAGIVIEEPGRVVAGAFTGGESSPATARREERLQLQDSVSAAFRRHQVKFGVDAQAIGSAFVDLYATHGQYWFEATGDFLANRFSRFLQRFNTESRLSNQVVGLFVQDEWKPRPGLTVSAGVRWDSESILDDRDNFSPRLAIAFDPFSRNTNGQGKGWAQAGGTVIRAGFGVFYNRALLRTIDDFSLGKSTIVLDSRIAPAVAEAAVFPRPITDQSIVDRYGLRETGFLRRVSRDLEIPYTIQTGFGVERQVGGKLVVTADYIFTRGVHLWRESNVNAPVLPEGYSSVTDYLVSRDFDNRPGPDGKRPITGAKADVVRFDKGDGTATTPGAVTVQSGVRILTLGLNAPRSSNINAALNAVRFLRPDPSLTQVELLESSGNSFYHGAIFSARYEAGKRARFRAAYTVSKWVDEGTTNTASPQDLGDRRAERSLSLQDQRHRFSFAGVFQEPVTKVEFSPIVAIGSSRPFNIGAGFDRNLNDIENDRPNFIVTLERPVWRRPGSRRGIDVKQALALAPIGSSGNLPRNYGRGPGTKTINLRASRRFSFGERLQIRPAVDIFNVFNNSTFSFGAEFINREDADFLTPRRTARPREVQLSVRVAW